MSADEVAAAMSARNLQHGHVGYSDPIVLRESSRTSRPCSVLRLQEPAAHERDAGAADQPTNPSLMNSAHCRCARPPAGRAGAPARGARPCRRDRRADPTRARAPSSQWPRRSQSRRPPDRTRAVVSPQCRSEVALHLPGANPRPFTPRANGDLLLEGAGRSGDAPRLPPLSHRPQQPVQRRGEVPRSRCVGPASGLPRCPPAAPAPAAGGAARAPAACRTAARSAPTARRPPPARRPRSGAAGPAQGPDRRLAVHMRRPTVFVQDPPLLASRANAYRPRTASAIPSRPVRHAASFPVLSVTPGLRHHPRFRVTRL